MHVRRLPFLLAVALAGLAGWLVLGHRLPARIPAMGDFVWIPAGRFRMGSPLDEVGRDRSEVQHTVALSGFWLGRHPVTQAEWVAVTGRNPSSFRGSPLLPVEGVTWYDAIAYCNLKSLKDGLAPCYALDGLGGDPARWPAGWKQSLHDRITCDWGASGYRLPTEAEWEYACRSGSTAATPFGPSLSSRQANFNGEEPYGTADKGPNLGRTTPVGSYPPNAWGLFDMMGNVGQWCWDWYADYGLDSAVDPHGPPGPKARRVYRGGSWFSHGTDLRSAARFGDTPQFRLDMLPGGLRLARSAAPAR